MLAYCCVFPLLPAPAENSPLIQGVLLLLFLLLVQGILLSQRFGQVRVFVRRWPSRDKGWPSRDKYWPFPDEWPSPDECLDPTETS